MRKVNDAERPVQLHVLPRSSSLQCQWYTYSTGATRWDLWCLNWSSLGGLLTGGGVGGGGKTRIFTNYNTTNRAITIN